MAKRKVCSACGFEACPSLDDATKSSCCEADLEEEEDFFEEE